MIPSAEPPDKKSLLAAELKRLKAKRAEVTDKDIRSALTLRIDAIEGELPSLETGLIEVVPEEVEELPPPPTAEQAEEAERFVQLARLEKNRGNSAKSQAFLQQAIQTAPGSSAVQELIGDEQRIARQNKDALSSYSRAMRLDANNLSAAKKHAELVFATKAISAQFDLAGQSDQLATDGKKAMYFSIFLPGAGQLVLGETILGLVYMISWGAMVFWLFLAQDQLKGFLGLVGIKGHGTHPTGGMVVFIPLILSAVIQLASIGGCLSKAGKITKKPTLRHPEPPVSLPFD